MFALEKRSRFTMEETNFFADDLKWFMKSIVAHYDFILIRMYYKHLSIFFFFRENTNACVIAGIVTTICGKTNTITSL